MVGPAVEDGAVVGADHCVQAVVAVEGERRAAVVVDARAQRLDLQQGAAGDIADAEADLRWGPGRLGCVESADEEMVAAPDEFGTQTVAGGAVGTGGA